MKHYFLTLFTFLALTVPFSGCSSVGGNLASMVPTPDVAYKGVRLGGLSKDALEVILDLDVTNKIGIPLSLAGFDYDFQVQGTSLLKNEVNEAMSIPGMGTGSVSLPLKIPFGDLYGLYDSLAGAKNFDYLVSGGFKLNVPGFGPLRVPLKHEGNLPVVKPPTLSVAGMTPSANGFTVDLEVGNPNFFNVALNQLTYGLKINGSPALKQATLDAIDLEPGGKQTVSVPVEADLVGLGFGLFNLITKKGKMNYDFVGDVDLNTGLERFPRLKMPLNYTGKF